MAKRPARQPDPALQRAMRLIQAGDLLGAESALAQAARSAPRDPEVHFTSGVLESRRDRHAQAVPHFERAVSLNGKEARYHAALARALSVTMRKQEALDAVERARWLDPGVAEHHQLAARLLERLGRLDDAASAIDKALAADPNDPRSRLFRVRLAVRRGERDAWPVDEWQADLRAIAQHHRSPALRVQAWDVLGEFCDAAGRHDAAFEAFLTTMAEEERRSPSPPPAQRDAYLASIDAYADALMPDRAARWKRERPDDGLPPATLLVGFPRSGTTMTERALDAHPGIVSLEETPVIGDTLEEARRLLSLPDAAGSLAAALDDMPADIVASLRRFYRDLACRDAGQPPDSTATILDKNPMRLTELAFINRVFPDAHVLVALRDPRDVCLSCLRQRFRPNVAMSFFRTLDGTATMYERLMGAWLRSRSSLTLAWHEVRYEDTVADFEARMREIVAFLGLGWHDGVLSFQEHQRDRVAATPSYHAVRQAVTTGAVGRWRDYETGLAPILPRLAPFVEAFGYA